MQRVIAVGSINMDVIAEAPRMPHSGETIFGTAVSLLPGGKGANQAVAAHRAGNPTLMVGALGSDSFGESLRVFLSEEGLDIEHVSQVDGPSGTAIITVDPNGENVIVIIPGANSRVGPEMVSSVTLTRNDVVLMQNEIPELSNQTAVEMALSAQAVTILNLAPYRETSAELLESVDYLVVNETEFAQLVGEDPQSMTGHQVVGLLAQGAGSTRNLIVTLGAAGLVARLSDTTLTIPGHEVSVKDTTGAGDSFCGAFGAALANSYAPEEALRFANVAAALSVQRLGASPSMPTLDEIRAAIVER